MFRANTRPLNKQYLRAFFKFLIVIILFQPIPEGTIAHSEHRFQDELEEIYCKKKFLNESERIIFEETKNTFIRIFYGIYNIQDNRFKKIYEGQGYIYGFGLSKKVYNIRHHNFFLSLDFRFYTKKGTSTYTHEDTKLILRPISLGGVYMFVTEKIIPFAEIGSDYYSYQEKSLLHSASGNAWGFHLKGGILIPLYILKSLKAKIYFRFSKAKTVENDLEVNLGGIEYGIGIIYEFNIF